MIIEPALATGLCFFYDYRAFSEVNNLGAGMRLINWGRDISASMIADLVGRDLSKERYGEENIFQQPSEVVVDKFNKQSPGAT